MLISQRVIEKIHEINNIKKFITNLINILFFNYLLI